MTSEIAELILYGMEECSNAACTISLDCFTNIHDENVEVIISSDNNSCILLLHLSTLSFPEAGKMGKGTRGCS